MVVSHGLVEALEQKMDENLVDRTLFYGNINMHY